MTNPFGESGLERKKIRFTGLLPALMTCLLLVACAGSPPAPVEDLGEVDREVRQPAQEESEGVQVFPLQNPAVKELLAKAGEAEDQGRYDDAGLLLERALRIQPRDPELLQQMAEVQLVERNPGALPLGFWPCPTTRARFASSAAKGEPLTQWTYGLQLPAVTG